MMVFGHGGGVFLAAGKLQVHPLDCEAEVSQRLVESSHSGDLRAAMECLVDPHVDVNYAGAVWLRTRTAELVLREEAPNEVRFQHCDLRTEVSSLFLAAHVGHRHLVRKLLNAGANVNQKLFRGFATTAAVREGRADILELLVKSGAAQPACEEALLEACYHSQPKLVELLMASDLIRPQIAAHTLVSACTRGFVDVVDVLTKCGVNPNAMARVLLQSLKPSLHANVDCNPLIAAVVSRQTQVVRHLLQAGVEMDAKVSLGAWSWDTTTGEEFRVGVGLSDPYDPTWCAVEYFESTGTVLRLLLQHHPVNAVHQGRTLLHHSILCANPTAVSLLLDSGADAEFPIETTTNAGSRPLHMAARLGSCTILQTLIDSGCNIDSRTDSSETAVMLSVRHKREDCLKLLAKAGADFGLVNSSGASAASIATSNQWADRFQQVMLEGMRSGQIVKSTNPSIFSPMMFASRCGDVRALEALVAKPGVELDEQDVDGYTPAMVAAKEGYVEAFRFLVFAGANVKLRNKYGETAITISQSNKKKDLFEKVMLEHALEKGMTGGFYALHCAARRGDVAAARLLTTRGYDVNILDEDDYTPLMLAAREGHGDVCALLISSGARCDIKTSRGETALSLAKAATRRDVTNNAAEQIILDELCRMLVSSGGKVKKHTKGGRGSPHRKVLLMVGGLLRWGRSSRRNVACKEVEIGSSLAFQRCRRRKGDGREAGVFRVVTTKNKEFHFVCEGGSEAAELWVRGIRLLSKVASA